MKRIFLTISILCFLMPSMSFWYLEAKLYCSVNQQAITVSMSATVGGKCQEYLLYIEEKMRSLARDLYILQEYIVNGQDPAYRTKIKAEKLAMIDKLQAVRLNVIANMKTFEYNLLRKSVTYFVLRITPYKITLTSSAAKLEALTGAAVTPEVVRMTSLISGQIQTIDKIANVQTFDELLPLFKGYLYFQQQIA